MASSSKRHDAGGPITEWTVFNEETGVRVASYVLEAHSKVASRDYGSAGDVLDDYETCVKLLINLMEESSKFDVALYDRQYFYNYAMQTKGKMLAGVFTMVLANPHLLKRWENWIQNKDLFNTDKAAHETLLSESENSITRMNTNVERMDEKLQSDIKKLKEEHFQFFNFEFQSFAQTLTQIQAEVAKSWGLTVKLEHQLIGFNESYEKVKCATSNAAVDMRSVTKLARSCNSSLGILEETIVMLQTVFFELQRRREKKELSKKWLEVTQDMDQHHLVRSEKEKNEKARVYRDMCWEKLKQSSGLLH